MTSATSKQLAMSLPRFFRPQGTPPGTADSGFLPNIESASGRAFSGQSKELKQVLEHPCVVILGEPGIGKSTVMAQRRMQLPSSAEFHDLRFDGPQTVLESARLRNWQQGGGPLHLVLDSLDESQDRRFAAQLSEHLRRGPIELLRLEIACRAADWPPVLDEGLADLFPGALGLYHIEPLRREDAHAVARSSGVDPDAFLRAVIERELGSLACIPLTLHLLISVFRQRNALPNGIAQLYEDAALLLCTERSTTRISARDNGGTDPKRRLEIAEGLAAATILCRRTAITSLSPLLCAPHELSLSTHVNSVGGEKLSMTELQETLGSGLFTRHGPEHWSWFHLTLAEYLAARWINRAALSLEQVKSLLFNSTDPDHIVPQLVPVGVWLGTRHAETLSILAERAPEAFVSCDSSLATDEQRVNATRVLLERARDETITRTWWRPFEYARLVCPKVDHMVEGVIFDSSSNELVRKIALAIAGASRNGRMAERLCELAEDTTQNASTRASAVEAAFRCTGDASIVVGRLRPLAEPGDTTDPYEEVRAAVLSRLWPKYLEAPELFRMLTMPQRPNTVGSYQHFVYGLATSLEREHLLSALEWVEQHVKPFGRNHCFAFEALSPAICRKAWSYVHERDIRSALARAVYRRLMTFHDPFRASACDEEDGIDVQGDHDRRHALVQAIIEEILSEGQDASILVRSCGQSLVHKQDLGWVLAMWRESSPSRRSRWASVVSDIVLCADDEGALGAVLDEIGQVRESELLPCPRFVDLDSEEATRARADQRALEQLRSQLQRQTAIANPFSVDPEAYLKRVLGGDLEAWSELVSTDKAFGWTDPRRAGCWSQAGNSERVLWLSAARRYVQGRPEVPDRERRLGSERSFAAYLALRFLYNEDAAWLQEHAGAVSANWASAVIDANPALNSDSQENGIVHQVLIKMVFEHALGESRAALRDLLSREAAGVPYLPVLSFLPEDERVASTLEECLRSARTCNEAFTVIFEALLRIGRRTAIRLAERLLLRIRRPRMLQEGNSVRRKRTQRRCGPAMLGRQPAVGDGSRSLSRLVNMCGALLGVADPACWTVAWRACRPNIAFGRMVFRQFTTGFHRENWGGWLPPQVLAELYIWLEQNAPIPEPRDRNAFIPELEFRASLLRQIASHDTAEAVGILADVLQKFPQAPRVRRAWAAALYAHHENSWVPPEPAELFRLVESRATRIVKSNAQLMTSVIEALHQYEAELHGETPTIQGLWNYWFEDRRKVYEPKDENDFSDHLAAFLRKALRQTVINREVEIRPTEGARAGQRTDLLVQAIHPSTDERFEVVIEVKGSWNDEIVTGFATQLIGRYLTGGELRCGIYLVGWFDCESWSSADRRRSATRRHERAGLEAELASYARQASVGKRLVRALVIETGIRSDAAKP